MGGKTTKQTTDQSTTAQTQLPAWMTQGGQQLYQQAQAASAANPVTAYTGQRTAADTANQQQAAAMAAQRAGQWQPQLNQAAQMAQAAGSAGPSTVTAAQWDDTQAQKYMNPYQSAVQANTIAQMRQQDAMDRAALGDQAAAAHAYGGARQGVEQAQQEKNQALARQNYLDSSNAAGYAAAQQQFNADAGRSLEAQTANAGLSEQALSRGLSGAGLLGQLAQGASTLGAQDVALLSETGAQQQATQQAGLDAQYQDFLRNQNAGMDRYAQLMSILQGTPHDTTTTGTMQGTQTTKETGGFLKDLMGTLMAAGSTAGSLGWAPFASDRRLKRDISLIRRLANGLGVYRFAYLWERGPARHIGAMADEVAAIVPAALGPTILGFGTVRYDKLREAI